MNRIMAYVILNVKSLWKDKIPFVWSVFFPLIMFWIEKDAVKKEQDLLCWWIYMILCAYFYGVSIYALELKEAGCLRTIFSINNSSIEFFAGNLLTQIIFCTISLGIFNTAISFINSFSFVRLYGYSFIVTILCIPFAFLGYSFVLIRNIHVNAIRTIISIVLFGMFMLMSIDSAINQFNPMYYITVIFTNCTWQNIAAYSCISAISIVLGSIGIIKFDPNSNERR